MIQSNHEQARPTLNRRLQMLLCAIGLSSTTVYAGTIIKADNADALNLNSSWTGGAVPGTSDIATWNSTVSGANSVILGADASWQGISVSNPGGAVTIGGANTLTIGRSGIDLSAATQNLTISSNLSLLSNVNQVWNVASGRTLSLNTGVFTRGAGATLNIQGAGTVSTSNMANDATGILGPWASFGSGASTSYATFNGSVITGYTGGTSAATAANVTSTSGTVNYDVAAVGTFGTGAAFHTVRYTGATGTIAGAFTADGLMNVGEGALTFSGAVTIGSSLELVVNTANGDVVLQAAVKNNGTTASALTKMGDGVLTLSGTNTYTGGTYINQGTVAVTVGGGLGGAGNTVNLAQGAVLSLNTATTYTFGNIVGGGTINAMLGSGSSTLTLSNSSLSGFTGVLNVGNGAQGGKMQLNATTGGSSASAINVNANGTLYVNSGITVNAALTLYGGDTGESLGQLRLEGGSSYAGAITLAGDLVAGDFTIGGNGSVNTISGVISESGGSRALSKGGNGTIVLTAANTYTGGTTIGTGTLTLGNGGTTGSLSTTGAVTITGGTFAINRSDNVVQGVDFGGAAISGAGALTMSGSGTLTLNAANTYSGATTVSSGVLQLANANAVQNSTLTVNAANGVTFTSGIGSFVAGGLAGNATGTLLLQDTLSNAVALTFGSNNANTTFSGVISGAGSLTKMGTGTITLSGSNTYTGVTTISGGIVSVSSINDGGVAGNLGQATNASANLVLNGGTLKYTGATASTDRGMTLNNVAGNTIEITTGSANLTDSGVLTGAGGFIKTGSGTLTLNAANTYTGGTTITAGTLTLGNGGTTGSLSTTGAVTITGGTFVISRSDNVVQGVDFGGAAITGAGALTMSGSGTLTLNAVNTYTGATTVSSGVLQLANANAVQNSTLTINAANGVTFASGISSFVVGGLAGNSTGTLLLQDTASTAVTLTFGGNNADTTMSGIISGTGGIVKNGSGVASFNTTNANTYSGGTVINSGTVRLGVSTAYTAAGITSGSLGTGNVTFADGTTLAALGTSSRHLFSPLITILGNMTIGQTTGGTGSVELGGTIDLGNGTRTLTVVNGASTVAINQQKLTFRNDIGQTVVQNGTLRVVGDPSFAAGTEAFVFVNSNGMSFVSNAGLTIGPRAHLYFRNGNTMSTGGTAATLTIEAGGTMDLSNLTTGSLSQEVFSLSGAGTVTNSTTGSGTAILTVSGSSSTTFSGTIQDGNAGNGGTGKVALTKSGSGTLTLTGTNTATGVTTVSAGMLQYGKVSALYNGDTSKWTAANIRVASGGTLAFNVGGTGEFATGDVTTLLTQLASSSNATTNGMAAGSNLGFDTTNASGGKFTVADVIANTTGTAGGARGLTKLGTGTLALTGANTYTGVTTVSAGVLQVGSAGTGSTGSGAVMVQSGGSLLGTGLVKGASFTAASGATVQAGDGSAQSNYGTLTFTPVSGSGSFDFQAGSNIILGINPSGTGDLLSFDGLSAGTLNFNGNIQITASGFTPTSAQTFNLLDWNNVSTVTFNSRFSSGSYGGFLLGNGDDSLGFDLPDISGSGYAWDISNFMVDGTISVVLLVPEPSRVLVLALGLGACLLRRRRHRGE